jgi:hypothetical protein
VVKRRYARLRDGQALSVRKDIKLFFTNEQIQVIKFFINEYNNILLFFFKEQFTGLKEQRIKSKE